MAEEKFSLNTADDVEIVKGVAGIINDLKDEKDAIRAIDSVFIMLANVAVNRGKAAMMHIFMTDDENVKESIKNMNSNDIIGMTMATALYTFNMMTELFKEMIINKKLDGDEDQRCYKIKIANINPEYPELASNYLISNKKTHGYLEMACITTGYCAMYDGKASITVGVNAFNEIASILLKAAQAAEENVEDKDKNVDATERDGEKNES